MDPLLDVLSDFLDLTLPVWSVLVCLWLYWVWEWGR